MVAFLAALVTTCQEPQALVTYTGHDVGVRAVRQGSEVALEFFIVGAEGAQATVAVSSTHTGAKVDDPTLRSLSRLGLTSAERTDDGIALQGGSVSCTVHVPSSGRALSVEVKHGASASSFHDALFGIALAPNGAPAKATSQFLPPGGSPTIATTERFAAPIALVSGGGYSIALMPDVQDLVSNRPMPPVLLLRNDGRYSPAAILSYGFAPYDRDENWTPRLANRDLGFHSSFSWKFDLIVTRQSSAVEEVNRFVWSKYGAERARRPLPQVVPLRYYTKPTYALETGDSEEEEGPGKPETPGLWWTQRSLGRELRAPKGADGMAKLTTDGNIARFAWGLRWWGDRLKQDSWSEHADEVMNLVASAPLQQGKTTTEFDLDKNTWRFGQRDRTSEAVNARWKLAYAESFFYTRNDQLVEQVEKSARSLMDSEPDGTIALLLQGFAQSPAIRDARLKALAKAHLEKSKLSLQSSARAYAESFEPPSIVMASLALFLARESDAESRAVAASLLQAMFLYQAVWKPATVSGTEIFGAFVGEHLAEESQSNYSDDLLAASVALDDPVLCARALAALRAPLALFNHPAHGISGISLPSTIALNRSAPWFGENGQEAFGSWRGVAEGIGQTLTSAADALNQFGSYYRTKSGLLVGIDGIEFGSQGVPMSAFSRNPIPFEGVFPYEGVDGTSSLRTQGVDPPRIPAMRALVLEQDAQGLIVVAQPGFTVTDAEEKMRGNIVFADGTRTKAEFFPTGLGARVTELQLTKGAVSFAGTYGETPLSIAPTPLLVGPPSPGVAWPMGWRWMKGLSDVTASTAQALDTADDGRGNRNEGLTGVIESQQFLLSQPTIRFVLTGKMDKATRVELVDAALGVPVFSAQKRGDSPEEIVWNLERATGQSFFVRIVDESKAASIRVSELRQEANGRN